MDNTHQGDAIKKAYETVSHFMSVDQLNTEREVLGDEFDAKIANLALHIRDMPTTFGQSDKENDMVAYLCYNKQDSDTEWYITEKDTNEKQFEVFGFSLHKETGLITMGIIKLQDVLEKDYQVNLDFKPTSKSKLMKQYHKKAIAA
jgi:hypothetical protein